MAEILDNNPIASDLTMDNMPPEMLDKILDKLEPIEKLRAKRVCRKFYGSVNRLNPGFLTIQVYTRAIWYNGLQLISYRNRGNNCHVRYAGKEKIIENSNYLDVMISDLFSVLKNRRLDLTLLRFSCGNEVFAKIQELAVRNELINVRTVYLSFMTDIMHPTVTTILNLVSCNNLQLTDIVKQERPNLELVERRYREIYDWVPAMTKIDFDGAWFDTFPIDSFLKFKIVELNFKFVTFEQKIRSHEVFGNIIQVLLTSENLESCLLSGHYHKDFVIEVLKDELHLQGNENIFKVPIPDKNEHYSVEVLEKEIKITRSGI